MTDAVEFTDLPLDPALLQGLDALGHVRMTPIQARSLPALLEGQDLIAQAPTGSGKTAAFGLALLHRIDLSQIRAQALVLCPTRELADQVAKHIRKLGTGMPNLKLLTLTGGVALGPQLASLEVHAPHVVVGTPGRVQELLRKKALDLRGVRVLVLDEADRLLDMGFEEPIREIVKATPKTRQTLLFSATFPDAVREIARTTMRDPVEVTVEGAGDAAPIEQRFYEVEAAMKPAALAGLLLEHGAESTRSCSATCGATPKKSSRRCRTSASPRRRCTATWSSAIATKCWCCFANRSCTVLVASDVAARGLDVDDLGAVVNYDVPNDPDTYVHRIGRTGRAGRNGIALTLCTPREQPRVRAIEEALKMRIELRRPPMAALRANVAPRAAMATLRIDGGRTDKLRPGDIVGALTGEGGLKGDAIGKIDVFATRSYVAIQRAHVDRALARLQAGRIKAKKFRVRRV
jgi:ATP-independent RNA helicase DbpA